ncbi:putative oligonucleotidase [Helianthus annuus]|nr:putative oligonucleotidase [Helianthus annuus]
MPDLASLFSHVLVDVRSVKALCCHWFPEDVKKAPKKEKKHGAVLDEIKESITELKYYKEHAFRSPKSKRRVNFTPNFENRSTLHSDVS